MGWSKKLKHLLCFLLSLSNVILASLPFPGGREIIFEKSYTNEIKLIEVASRSGDFILCRVDGDDNYFIEYIDSTGMEKWTLQFSERINSFRISTDGSTILVRAQWDYFYNRHGELLCKLSGDHYDNYQISPNGEYFLKQKIGELTSFHYFTKYGEKVTPDLPETLSLNQYYLSFSGKSKVIGLLTSDIPLEHVKNDSQPGRSYLVSFDPVTNELLWTGKIFENPFFPTGYLFSYSSGIITDKYIYLYNDNTVYKNDFRCYSVDGFLVWNIPVSLFSESPWSGPKSFFTDSQDRLYLIFSTNEILVIDNNNGEIVERYRLKNNVGKDLMVNTIFGIVMVSDSTIILEEMGNHYFVTNEINDQNVFSGIENIHFLKYSGKNIIMLSDDNLVSVFLRDNRE